MVQIIANIKEHLSTRREARRKDYAKGAVHQLRTKQMTTGNNYEETIGRIDSIGNLRKGLVNDPNYMAKLSDSIDQLATYDLKDPNVVLQLKSDRSFQNNLVFLLELTDGNNEQNIAFDSDVREQGVKILDSLIEKDFKSEFFNDKDYQNLDNFLDIARQEDKDDKFAAVAKFIEGLDDDVRKDGLSPKLANFYDKLNNGLGGNVGIALIQQFEQGAALKELRQTFDLQREIVDDTNNLDLSPTSKAASQAVRNSLFKTIESEMQDSGVSSKLQELVKGVALADDLTVELEKAEDKVENYFQDKILENVGIQTEIIETSKNITKLKAVVDQGQGQLEPLKANLHLKNKIYSEEREKFNEYEESFNAEINETDPDTGSLMLSPAEIQTKYEERNKKIEALNALAEEVNQAQEPIKEFNKNKASLEKAHIKLHNLKNAEKDFHKVFNRDLIKLNESLKKFSSTQESGESGFANIIVERMLKISNSNKNSYMDVFSDLSNLSDQDIRHSDNKLLQAIHKEALNNTYADLDLDPAFLVPNGADDPTETAEFENQYSINLELSAKKFRAAFTSQAVDLTENLSLNQDHKVRMVEDMKAMANRNIDSLSDHNVSFNNSGIKQFFKENLVLNILNIIKFLGGGLEDIMTNQTA